MLHGGGQLLDVHQHRGVAADADHGLVGVGDLRADRRRQAVAHGARAARREPAPRAFDGQVLRGPHLVLAHIGGDNRVAAGQLGAHGAHQLLRQDGGLARREGQAVGGAPAFHA
ncbi:hypothetical protein D3C71_1749800 [compost metagenome]